ncbi:cellulase family glycosylhydrolase [Sphingobacterium sp. DN00404]|uniref:mannan endo-1,4-beta-mannosidase n=1 Tax=Sphingobacterium micropteri TaxID=2763501 RepID=A0ABR7YP52_9SPHI|nr:cellulase family glycosylhydrolase [Sphingobacterium micropteri]MBD1433104.1 cellulase family glycosylhydrolase [Sphingobacterium micropteri]
MMILRKSIIGALTCFSVLTTAGQESTPQAYLDDRGVIRWSDSKEEIALYGANYCLPSACDYRAAGYLTDDRKKVIDQDMAHFARMNFDALRVCIWGDYENTDKEGNLIENDHLDLVDYLVAKAKERGIHMLLSPIVTYSSLFPDAMGDTLRIQGSLSHTYKKGELGTNPAAIEAQCNYISQLLNHVNPYTKMALKDDPSILFIEMINEPTHHSADVKGSVRYINALIDAVRRTGCDKLVFHNVSQDFDIDQAMGKSDIQGASFAWYPSGLNSGGYLPGNYLPSVDKFSERMMSPHLQKLGRIVYEFDSPDLVNGYMYPAMARSFRTVGAQFATMFSYDMLVTAPYNLGWQTHYLNMVYTPGKAVSAMIAAEVMRTVPMYKDYGKYPANTVFEDFRLHYEDDLGELNSDEKFYYTNHTDSKPVALDKLQKIAGVGSSPVVQYEGRGIYFLDKIDSKTWRLEVYPDALPIRDPFEMPSPDKVVTRSISRTWPMQVRIPGLGDNFHVVSLNDGNSFAASAVDGTFGIHPGVYMLTADKTFDIANLPRKVGQLKMDEFVSLPDQELPLQVVAGSQTHFNEGKPLHFTAEVYHRDLPDSVQLFVKVANSRRFIPFTMHRTSGYTYEVSVPWRERFFNAGPISWCIVVDHDGRAVNYPSQTTITPLDWNFSGCETWDGQIVPARGAIKLVDVASDFTRISASRMDGGVRANYFSLVTSDRDGEPAIRVGIPYDHDLEDYTISLPVEDVINPLGSKILEARHLVISAKGLKNKQEAFVTLVEKDGTSWSSLVPVTADWQDIRIPVDQFSLNRGVMLPVGYPGRWNYWLTPASDRGHATDKVRLDNLQSIQVSMRPATSGVSEQEKSSSVDISQIYFTFN